MAVLMSDCVLALICLALLAVWAISWAIDNRKDKDE